MAKKPGMYYVREAAKAGCDIRQGKGDHVIVYSPDHTSQVTVPRSLNGNGTECKIVKWMKAFGILAALSVIGYAGYGFISIF